MFYLPLIARIARRADQSKAKPSSGRLQLEALENRVVPTIPQNGTILITNYHTFDSNPSPPPPGIIGIDPSTGLQSLVAVNGSLAAGSTLFQKPSNLFEDPANSNVVYVTDDGNFRQGLAPPYFGSAAVLKVQFSSTSNPLVTIVSSLGYLYDPTGVAVINGSLYVTDTGNTTAQLGLGYVVKIDPSTGTQTYLPGTVHKFKCPVGLAPAYNSGQVDTTILWVADQGSNQNNEPNIEPVGKIWKVDLINPNNASTAISQGNLLTIHTVYVNPPQNQALGNLQDIAVDPSSGNLYVSQYGFRNFAGSVVSVNPNGGAQTSIAQDDGITDQPPTPASNSKLGWYVGPVGWDASYSDPTFHGVAVITAAADYPQGVNHQRGHVCAVDPTIQGTNDNNANVISENDVGANFPQHIAYIATPTGIITYKNTGSAPAPLPGPGHSPTILGSIDFSTPDTMDLSSITSSPPGAGLAINSLWTGTIGKSIGLSNLADPYIPDGRADGFWENHDVTNVPYSILTDRFPTKDNPWSMKEAYFTMEFAQSQQDWLVTMV